MASLYTKRSWRAIAGRDRFWSSAPERTAKFIKGELAKWAPIIREANVFRTASPRYRRGVGVPVAGGAGGAGVVVVGGRAPGSVPAGVKPALPGP